MNKRIQTVAFGAVAALGGVLLLASGGVSIAAGATTGAGAIARRGGRLGQAARTWGCRVRYGAYAERPLTGR